MTPLHLDDVDRAKLFLAIVDTLDVPREPETQRDRARAEYALAVSDRSGDPVDLFAALAVADDICFCTQYHDHIANEDAVSDAYSVGLGTTRRALKLTGWVKDPGPGGNWVAEYGATRRWVPEPTDLLVEMFGCDDE